MSTETITPEGLHAMLDDHGPDVCEDGHFACACGWHEDMTGALLKPWRQVWDDYIDHLTAPPIDAKEYN